MAPKSLDRLIGLVDLGSDSQKKSVITALNEVDENGCTGWSMVARYAPESIYGLIGFVSDKQKKSVITALNQFYKNGWTGWSMVARYAPKIL